MNPHQLALQAIQDNMLNGTTCEVVHKKPWGFAEIPNRTTYFPHEFLGLSSGTHFTNVILHILEGEGGYTLSFIIKKACEIGTRVLILERCDVKVDVKNAFSCNLNDRNTLYVMTPFFNSDIGCFNHINHNTLQQALDVKWRYYPETEKDIYALSSEVQPDWELFNLPCKPVYTIIGGFMFLELLHLLTPRKMVLFDISFKQILAAKLILGLIDEWGTLERFLYYFQNTGSERKIYYRTAKLIKHIDDFFNVDILCDWIYIVQEHRYWKSIVKGPNWDYQIVKRKLRYFDIQFYLGPCRCLSIPENSILYASTILPREFEVHKNIHLVESYTNRNIPTYQGYIT